MFTSFWPTQACTIPPRPSDFLPLSTLLCWCRATAPTSLTIGIVDVCRRTSIVHCRAMPPHHPPLCSKDCHVHLHVLPPPMTPPPKWATWLRMKRGWRQVRCCTLDVQQWWSHPPRCHCRCRLSPPCPPTSNATMTTWQGGSCDSNSMWKTLAVAFVVEKWNTLWDGWLFSDKPTIIPFLNHNQNQNKGNNQT